jgi:hypothetical protein
MRIEYVYILQITASSINLHAQDINTLFLLSTGLDQGGLVG